MVLAANTRSHSMAERLERELKSLGCGRVLGRYTLLRRIAVGGMAEVYTAYARGVSGFEKKVAIKKILPQYSNNLRFVEMLIDEAKITVSLAHPNIGQVIELGVDRDNNYFIVMEYVDGRPLSRLLHRIHQLCRALPISCALQIMADVTKGLDHAHKKTDAEGKLLSIVHRDVSPPNIIVSNQGDSKLIDFGIARAEGRSFTTAQDVIKGKLRYLAPEIASGGDVDQRADIYCCGVVLFEMLTGEPMFTPRDFVDAIELARDAPIRLPGTINPSVSEALNAIVARACARDPNERFQSAKDLHSELRLFLNQRYPEFMGNEPGELIQSMFASELKEERELDAVAERIARQAAGMPADEEAPTLFFTRPRPAYRKLVGVDLEKTRVEQMHTHITVLEPSDVDEDAPDETLRIDAHGSAEVSKDDFEIFEDSFSAMGPLHGTAATIDPFPRSDTQPDLHPPFESEVAPPAEAPRPPSITPAVPMAVMTVSRAAVLEGRREPTPPWHYVVFGLGVLSMFSSIAAIAIGWTWFDEPPPPAQASVSIQVVPSALPPPVPVLGITSPALAAPEPPVSTDPETPGLTARALVKTTPPSAIIVDGKARGRTPILLRLKPGLHEIVLRGPNGEVRKMVKFMGRGKNPPINLAW